MPQQTFTFTDAAKEYVAVDDGMNDPTFFSAATHDVALAAWLERPLLVKTLTWNVGEDLPEIYFNPWSTYLENPTVIQKLNNFKFLRCKMNMKITVAASQMHYGRGMVSYRPMLHVPGERFQADSSYFDNPIVSDSYSPGEVQTYAGNGINSVEAFKLIQSQWPKIFIDPGQSTAGCMQFPFIFQSNYFDLNKRDWIMNNQSFFGYNGENPGTSQDPLLSQERQPFYNDKNVEVNSTGKSLTRQTHMGVVHSSSLAPLLLAQGTSNNPAEPCTIQIFLWASDVELAVPTSVPMQGILDYTPPVVFPQTRTEYVPDLVGELSRGTTDDYNRRVTFDPALLDGDPSTIGSSSNDEMSISAFAGRECYYNYFEWKVDSAANTALYQMKVTPRVYLDSTLRTLAPVPGAGEIVMDSIVHHTPMSYCSLPFTHWRGSIKYRFQIVASNFHRGKLRFVFDPTFDALMQPGNQAATYREDLTNTQYQRVIDLGSDDGRDFTIDVKYMQPRPYLPLSPVGAFVPFSGDTRPDSKRICQGQYNETISSSFPLDPTVNGQFTIYVLNELVVNSVVVNPVNSVRVNVFVSAGDDLEFQGPTDSEINKISYALPTGFPANFGTDSFVKYDRQKPVVSDLPVTLQSDGDQAALGEGEEENVPVDPPVAIEVGETVAPINAVFYGEKFDNFMPLMNRWVRYTSETFPNKFNDHSSITLDLDDESFESQATLGEELQGKVTGTENYMIVPNFPPFPGPGLQAAAFHKNTLFDTGLPAWQPDPENVGWLQTAYPGLYQPTNSLNITDEDPLIYNNPVPPNKFYLNASFKEAQVPVDISATPPQSEVQAIPALDYTDALTTNPGNNLMLHFVSKMFLGRKGSLRNKYVVVGGSSTASNSELLVAKRLPENNFLAPVLSDTLTLPEEPPSVNEGAIGTNLPNGINYSRNITWPVSFSKWSQSFFSRPVFTDIDDSVRARFYKIARDNPSLISGITIPGYDTDGPLLTSLKRISETLWASRVNETNNLYANPSSNNIVPHSLSSNSWPYFNYTAYNVSAGGNPTENNGNGTQRRPRPPGTFPYIDRDLSAKYPISSEMGNLFPGAEANSVRHQPVLEVEIPFYENHRFEFIDSCLANTTGISAHAVYAKIKNLPNPFPTRSNTNLSEGVQIERWVRPGTDFSLFYLLNAPTVYDNSLYLFTGIPEYTANAESYDFKSADPSNELSGPAYLPYNQLKIFTPNRSETALPGYRGVNQNVIGATLPSTIRYLYRNRSRNVPYFTSVAPQDSKSISGTSVPNTVL